MILEHARVGPRKQHLHVGAVEIGAADAPAMRGRYLFVTRLEPNKLVHPGIADFGHAGPMIDEQRTVTVEPRAGRSVRPVPVIFRAERLMRPLPAIRIDQFAVELMP